MPITEYHYPISLTLVAATKCNIACQYCKINNTLNDFSSQLFKNTIQAFEDKSYLNNVITAFERLNYSLKNIKEFQIWGQEPTLILPYLTNQWDEWQNILPNLEAIMFSTNTMDKNWSDIIYNFILQINNNAKHPLKLTLQISYDGSKSTNEIRCADDSIIKNNLISLINKINNTKLSHLTEIVFAYHGVLSQDIFNNLTTIEQIEEYVSEINNFLDNLNSITINKVIRHTGMTLMVVNGVNNISTEDGINLANFLKKLDNQYNYWKNKYPFFYYNRTKLVSDILGPKSQEIIKLIEEKNFNNLDELINNYYLRNKDYMANTNTCLPIIGDFKIMYDGTSTFCQNSLHDVNFKEDKLTDSIFDQSRKYQMRHLKVNLVKDSIEDVNNFVNYITNYFHEGLQYTFLNQNMNYLYLLARAGQASDSYLYDFKKLKRHAFLLSLYNSCHWNLTLVTGSPDLRNFYDVRLLGNGVLDLFEESIEREVRSFVST